MLFLLSRRLILADALSLPGRLSSSFVRNVNIVPNVRRSLWKELNNGYQPYHQRQQQHRRIVRNIQSLVHHSTSTDDSQLQGGNVLIERYAIVSRNKQSMSFRNGSPLVFSGAIDSTVHLQFGMVNDDEGDEDERKSIPSGAFVGVMVRGKGDDSKNNRKDGGKGGKQRRNRNKRGGKTMHHEVDTIKHYCIDSSTTGSDEHDEGTSTVNEMLSQSNLIGYGVYNPSSLYRVRILCHQSSHPDMFKRVKNIMTSKSYDGDGLGGGNTSEEAIETIVTMKFRDAILVRKGLNLPSVSTDSYRLVNGEGDGLSGLAIDILGGRVAVIMSSAAWCEIYKHVIIRAVETVLRSDHPDYFTNANKTIEFVWRTTPSRLLQDGYVAPDHTDNSIPLATEGIIQSRSDESPIIVTENSIRYKTFPYSLKSQKTGFYVDQRENRFNLSSYCRGKRVLDLCCYTGGFALNAAIHGHASLCVGVDSSQDAINAAIENAALNKLPKDSTVQFLRDDIASYMKDAAANNNEDGQYDVIILDPPKLAPSVSGLERASRKYHSLNRDAIKLINEKDGGMLLTCTCSGAMTQKNGGQYFLETIKGAALSAGRQITLLKSSGAASCHTQCPASFPAGAYLTAALFYVSPKTSK